MKSTPPENVILVHGLWLHGVAFFALRYWLERRGFSVHCFSYASVVRGLDANSRALARCLGTISGERIALVGHSLGGLVILNMLALFPDPRIARVVLMGSPCAGSHCASFMLRWPLLSTLAGRSLRDAVGKSAWPLPAGVDVGVIAGRRSFGLGRVVPGLAQPNDGVVALAETRLAGNRDCIVLPVSHSQMLVSSSCAQQIASFLRSGRFCHD